MSNDERSRTYPTRPYLAVSAAIFREGRVLIVRRARPPAHGLYTLPGGGVELGETLEEAVAREVREETGLEVEPRAAWNGISSSCRSRRAGSPARFRSTRNWAKRIGSSRMRYPD